MDNENPAPASTTVESALPQHSGFGISALAGLQAGIVGVVWMFFCFFVAAFWGGGGIWSIPNLFSTAFYGESSYQNEFYRTTWAGVAFIVVLYGSMGALWGCFWRARRRPLLSLTGALTGLALYYFFFNYAWLHVSPGISLYAPVRELQVAHVFWGAALAKSPLYANRIAVALNPRGQNSHGTHPEPTIFGPDGRPVDQEPAETVSGEVIL